MELRKKSGLGDINLGFISVKMVSKARKLHEIIKTMNAERKKKSEDGVLKFMDAEKGSTEVEGESRERHPGNQMKKHAFRSPVFRVSG